MRAWAVKAAAGMLALGVAAGCSNPLSPKYEYEEQLYLYVDGSATVIIDASMPSLVALRRLPLDLAAQANVDREQVRAWFASAGCSDVRVAQPWVRSGRRFIQVRVAAAQVTDLARCGPLSWSSYAFDRQPTEIHYEQTVGASAGGDPGKVNWDGSELVAFRLHAPSKVTYHTVRRLKDGLPGAPDRGNILTWEQHLTDRRNGQPVHIEVRMGADSILNRTLWLFAGAFTAAVLTLFAMIWLMIRRAKRAQVRGTIPR